MNGMATVEKVVLGGDLAALTPAERLTYYKAVCESLRLNPFTRPFEYLKLSGKLVLYARKDCSEQLRTLHEVSITKLERETGNGIYTVTAYARNKDGREDIDLGVVSIAGLAGEVLSNAILKAVTKAKRRVTLSICGLGMLDETEVDNIPGAQRVDPETGEVLEPPQEARTADREVDARVISEAQLKRFHAIARGAGWSDAAVKGLLQGFGITSSKLIPRDQYEELCAMVKQRQSEEENPSQEEVPF